MFCLATLLGVGFICFWAGWGVCAVFTISSARDDWAEEDA